MVLSFRVLDLWLKVLDSGLGAGARKLRRPLHKTVVMNVRFFSSFHGNLDGSIGLSKRRMPMAESGFLFQLPAARITEKGSHAEARLP